LAFSPKHIPINEGEEVLILEEDLSGQWMRGVVPAGNKAGIFSSDGIEISQDITITRYLL
jgi:hypothetical protein